MGLSAQPWTDASNQIIAELFLARQVTDHFATLDDTQTKLFLDQNSEFPSIAADLRIAQAGEQSVVASVDCMDVFGVIVGILAAIPAPGLQAGAAAIQTALALGEALTPTLTGEEPISSTSIAQMRRHVAKLQQQTRDAITAQRRQVLGDYGLLATVGRLVASNIWQLDRQAALSSGRQGFTRSVYEAFIPVLWDRWEVTGCIVNRSFAKQTDCSVPSAGPLVKTTGLDFQGVFAWQKPCDFNPIGGKLTCRWKSFEELGYGDTVKTLLDPVTSACTYNAIAGTSWRYGCSLGISATELMREPPPPTSPWTFQVLRCKGKRPEARETGTCPEVQPGGPHP